MVTNSILNESLLENANTILEIRPRLLPSGPFPICCSLEGLAFNAIQPVQLSMSLYKPWHGILCSLFYSAIQLKHYLPDHLLHVS